MGSGMQMKHKTLEEMAQCGRLYPHAELSRYKANGEKSILIFKDFFPQLAHSIQRSRLAITNNARMGAKSEMQSRWRICKTGKEGNAKQI